MKVLDGVGEDPPEWFESVEEATQIFGVGNGTLNRWLKYGAVEGMPKDPSRAVSKYNPWRVSRKSLEEALIRKGMHPNEWPDPAVRRWIDPLPAANGIDRLRPDQIGNVGEHLVAYYMSACNTLVSLVDRRGMDHFVRLPNGEMFALEVKTASKPVSYHKHSDALRCRFTVRRKDADWFAFLDLSTNIVILKSAEELRRDNIYEISQRFFTPFYMNQSIQRLFQSYGCDPDPVLVGEAA